MSIRNGWVMLAVASTLTAGWTGGAEEGSGEPAGRLNLKTLILVKDSSADPVLFDRIVQNFREDISAVIRVAPDLPLSKDAAPENWAAAAAPLRGDSLWVLAVVGGSTNFAHRSYVSQKQHVAVLNLAWVVNAPITGEDRPKRIERLAQTEAMQLLGHALGLAPCLNPRCAMHGYDIKSGKPDFRGRNFCPPCKMKIDRTLGVDWGAIRTKGRTPPAPSSPPVAPPPPPDAPGS